MRVLLTLLMVCVAASAQLKDRGRPYISFAAGYDDKGSYLNQFPAYSALADAEFDMVQGENSQKFMVAMTGPGKYDWTRADELHAWAVAHHKKIRCHLVPAWVSNAPAWLPASKPTSAQLQTYATDYITAFLKRYPGMCYAADIANELFRPGTPRAGTVWMRSGDLWTDSPGLPYTQHPFPEGLAALFTAAHEADPSVKLCYNEVDADFADREEGKAASIRNLIVMFQRHVPKIPIHCVGLQFHLNSSQINGDFMKTKAQMESYASLGVETHITEMDVRVPASPSRDDLSAQAELYAEAYQTCLATRSCTVFQVWGLTDRFSWLGASAKPLLFDSDYGKKAAYEAMVKKAARQKRRP